MSRARHYLYVIAVNIILIGVGAEITFAAMLFLNKENVTALVPDYLYGFAASGAGENTKKAKLIFDENKSPIFVDGVKTYFESRVYSERGLLVSDERIIQNNSIPHRFVGVFGDSYTEALQVKEKDSFVALVNSRYEKLASNVHWLNFGVGATGTTDQLNRLKTIMHEHDLSGIVLFFLPQNDVLNNSLHPENGTLGGRSKSGCGKLPAWGKVIISNSFSGRGLCYYSMRYLGGLLSRSADEVNKNEVDTSKGVEYSLAERAHWYDVYNPPRDWIWRDAWNTTLESISEINDIAKQKKIPFNLIILTDSVQIFYNYNKHQFKRKVRFDYPNKRIMRFCKKMLIKCHDTMPYVLRHIDSNHIKFPFLSFKKDGHYSKLGHRVMYQYLIDSGMLADY